MKGYAVPQVHKFWTILTCNLVVDIGQSCWHGDMLAVYLYIVLAIFRMGPLHPAWQLLREASLGYHLHPLLRKWMSLSEGCRS